MDTLIAFISKLDNAEQKKWCDALNREVKTQQLTCTIVLDADLTPDQKQHISIAIVANPEPSLLANYPSLIWVQSLWAGVEKLVPHINNSSIKLSRLIDPILGQTMAEACTAWSFYIMRSMPLYQKQQIDKQWVQHPVALACDTTIGVLGLGELGMKAAKHLLQCGFNVVGWSQSKKELLGVECFSGNTGFEKVLAQSDIVICLLPLTDNTQGIFCEKSFGLMKEHASLINFSRGPLIEESALLDALNSRRLSHAVLDVFDQEPLQGSHIFWQHPHITVLPHISAPTNVNSACQLVSQNIAQYLELGVLPTLVDFSRGY